MNLRGSIAQQDRMNATIYGSYGGSLRLWIIVADKNSARIYRKLSHSVEELGETTLSETPTTYSDERNRNTQFIPPGMPEPPYEPAMKAARRRSFRFAYEMSSWLNLILDREGFDRLMIIAPPQTLLDMRRFLSKAALSRVVAEINRDLTRLNDDNINDDLENNSFF